MALLTACEMHVKIVAVEVCKIPIGRKWFEGVLLRFFSTSRFSDFFKLVSRVTISLVIDNFNLAVWGFKKKCGLLGRARAQKETLNFSQFLYIFLLTLALSR